MMLRWILGELSGIVNCGVWFTSQFFPRSSSANSWCHNLQMDLYYLYRYKYNPGHLFLRFARLHIPSLEVTHCSHGKCMDFSFHLFSGESDWFFCERMLYALFLWKPLITICSILSDRFRGSFEKSPARKAPSDCGTRSWPEPTSW